MENLSKQKTRYFYLWFFIWIFLSLILAVSILIIPAILTFAMFASEISINYIFVVSLSAIGLSYTFIKPISEGLSETMHEKMYYKYVLQVMRVEAHEVNETISSLIPDRYLEIVDVISSGTDHCIIKYKIPQNRVQITRNP